MRRLKCEMFGCTEIIKQYGVFVCQLCGTKYSVEEAKKMMFEESELAEAKNDNTFSENENYHIAYKDDNNKKIMVKTLSEQQKKKIRKLTIISIPIISVIVALAILFNMLVGSNKKIKNNISTGYYYTVGIKSDGTVVTTGNNRDGQCDVDDWNLFK